MSGAQIPQERSDRIARAVGSAVVAVATLEQVLLGEMYRRQMREDSAGISALEVFEEQPAGRILGKLREQRIEPSLAARIEEVLKRRNQMVHGLLGDLSVVRAIFTGDGIDEVEAGIAQIEADCGQIVAELQPLAAADIADRIGMSLDDAARALLQANLSKVEDPLQRARLEHARELIELTGWPDPGVFANLGGVHEPDHPA